MPSNIVNLNELVPGLEGKTFTITRANGHEDSYYVPGDLDSETVFEFLALFEEMVSFQEKVNDLQEKVAAGEQDVAPALREQTSAVRELTDSIKAKLLAVFQIADPSLTALPFGQATTMAVLGEVLQMMGLAAQDLPEPPPPPPPPTPRKPQDRKRKAPAAK